MLQPILDLRARNFANPAITRQAIQRLDLHAGAMVHVRKVALSTTDTGQQAVRANRAEEPGRVLDVAGLGVFCFLQFPDLFRLVACQVQPLGSPGTNYLCVHIVAVGGLYVWTVQNDPLFLTVTVNYSGYHNLIIS